jgi:cell fate regulator YaaT (PSP1 superfamily)
METELVRVRFLNDRREFHIPAAGIPLAAGDLVIVETDDGLDCCEVMAPAGACVARRVENPPVVALRKATPHDVEWLATKRQTEEAAAGACVALATKLALRMKLAGVKMTFDGSKLLFYFTADQRVDFRTLVRELAKRFRTRIEMRQIGVRDKAQRLGGLGVCGRPLCCTTFLAEFEPVTMKMAKEQNLTLSPSKISGFCGRLMCCLGFENDFYRGVRGAFPPVGSRVSTPEGEGEVRGISALTGEVTVGLDSGATVKVAREAATLIPAAAGGEKRGGEGRS